MNGISSPFENALILLQSAFTDALVSYIPHTFELADISDIPGESSLLLLNGVFNYTAQFLDPIFFSEDVTKENMFKDERFLLFTLNFTKFKKYVEQTQESKGKTERIEMKKRYIYSLDFDDNHLKSLPYAVHLVSILLTISFFTVKTKDSNYALPIDELTSHILTCHDLEGEGVQSEVHKRGSSTYCWKTCQCI